MIRILIIEDQNLVIQNLKWQIEQEKDLKVVGTANNGKQGIELVNQLQPDIAIISLNMHFKDGIETTYLITQNCPKTKVLIYTSSDGQMLNQAILSGAKGYLSKNNSREDLIAAIYAVKRNSVYIGEGILNPVQLYSSTDSQRSKLEQINIWLAKETIDWWCQNSLAPIPSAKQILENLGINQPGLSKMKDYLCQSKNTGLTLSEEITFKITRLFTEKNPKNPEQKLMESKSQLLNLLNSENYNSCFTTLYNNYQFLETTNLEKLQKQIAFLWQKASPSILLNCLHSVKKRLSNWQFFFKQKHQKSFMKENAAWQSFEFLLTSPNSQLNKQELCKKAAIFIVQCKRNSELNHLLLQLISKTIQQINIYLDILVKTNNLLSECKKQLEQQFTFKLELVLLNPFLEQLQEHAFFEKLRRDLETSIGHSLNQWGVSKSISESEIGNYLSEKIEPMAQEIYLNLRKEALSIFFLEYAVKSETELTNTDKLIVDY